MKINCIAIDDEPLALQQISGYIQKTPFLNLIASCKSAFEAMEILSKESVDLMFLDIQMPDLTGIEFVKAWKEGPKIIFSTAYEQYALDGFKADALDYILKPFGYEEFLKAAGKAKSYFDLLEKASHKPNFADNYIFVKSEYKLRKIFLKDIIYVEGVREYVKIVVNDDKPIMSLMSMKSFEEKLPTSHFMRVHRSFIVNLDYVNIIERGRIIFGSVYIPVSEQYKETFQQFLETGSNKNG
ncbi:MAG: LytTR family DNA-binding domain-containing protein [Bacteroidota bacterium]|nr:LytTR family DNA-binding domain-containing protein [Bacteroidota bacterium]